MNHDIDVGKVAAEAAEVARLEERLAILAMLRELQHNATGIAMAYGTLTVVIGRIEARSK